MKNTLKLLFLSVYFLVLNNGITQTLIYEDTFGPNQDGTSTPWTGVTSGTAPNNTEWRYTEMEGDMGLNYDFTNGEARLANNFGVNDGSGLMLLYKAGDGYYGGPAGLYEQTNQFTTTFKNNNSIIEWTINYRGNVASLDGLNNPGYGNDFNGAAFVLGITSPTLKSCYYVTNGYAVIFGDASPSGNGVKLVRVNGGVTTGAGPGCGTSVGDNYTFYNWTGGGGYTTDCMISADVNVSRNEWYSLKIQYNPVNDEWRLFLREDGASPGDPQNLGAAHCLGAIYDNTYTSMNLPIMGMYGTLEQSGTNRQHRFDNLRIKKVNNFSACNSSTGLCGSFNPCVLPAYNVNQPPTQCGGTVNVSGSVTSATAIISYHGSQADAESNSSPLSGGSLSTTTSRSFWARVENPSDSQCYEVVEIVVNIDTQTTPTLSYDGSTCVNTEITPISFTPAGGSFNISGDGSPTINNSNGTISNMVDVENYTITYTITNGTCPNTSVTESYTANICNNCSLNLSADNNSICLGDKVELTIIGDCSYSIASESFDSNTGWSNQDVSVYSDPCGIASEGTGYLWAGNDANSNGTRFLQTPSYDLTSGGCQICFDFKYGSGSGNCDSPETGEEARLEYRANSGAWVNIGTPIDLSITTWTTMCYNLPNGALSNSTEFRLRQTNVDETNGDKWGVDNLNLSCGSSTITLSRPGLADTIVTSGDVIDVYPSSLPTTYSVVIDDGVNSITRTVTITEDAVCCEANAGGWSP